MKDPVSFNGAIFLQVKVEVGRTRQGERRCISNGRSVWIGNFGTNLQPEESLSDASSAIRRFLAILQYTGQADPPAAVFQEQFVSVSEIFVDSWNTTPKLLIILPQIDEFRPILRQINAQIHQLHSVDFELSGSSHRRVERSN